MLGRGDSECAQGPGGSLVQYFNGDKGFPCFFSWQAKRWRQLGVGGRWQIYLK